LPGMIEEFQRGAKRPARLTRIRKAGPPALAIAPALFSIALLFLPVVGFSALSADRPWIQDLSVALRYRAALQRTPQDNGAFNETRKAADTIPILMAYSYSQAQLTAEGRQILSQLPIDLRQDLETAAQRHPELSSTDVAEARRMIPQVMWR